MLAEERRIRILQMLEEKNAVQLGELAALFRVSTETVRRDLLALEKQGRLQRTHGGAISMSRMAPDHILTTRIGEHQDLKVELSQRAAQLVHEGETLALDSGSTSAEFAKVLAQRFHELTVVTHSLDVVQALRRAPGIRIILCGGVYLEEENALWGQLTLDALEQLRVDKAFLCPDAVSIRSGAMNYSYPLTQVQRKMLAIANQVLFLADSSKFECIARLKITDLKPEYTLVTDSSLPEEMLRFYQNSGISIMKGES